MRALPRVEGATEDLPEDLTELESSIRTALAPVDGNVHPAPKAPRREDAHEGDMPMEALLSIPSFGTGSWSTSIRPNAFRRMTMAMIARAAQIRYLKGSGMKAAR